MFFGLLETNGKMLFRSQSLKIDKFVCFQDSISLYFFVVFFNKQSGTS